MRCYFNDIMGGVVFGIIIRVANRFWFKREIRGWLYALLFIIAGIYWECIAPLYITYSVGDVGDIAAYFGGGLIFLLLWKMLGGRGMKCRNCGGELNDTAKFCPQCGEKIKLYCTECGAELSLSARFCSSCGTPVVRKKVTKENELDMLDKKEVSINKNEIEDGKITEESKIQEEIALEKNQNTEVVIDVLEESQNTEEVIDDLEKNQDTEVITEELKEDQEAVIFQNDLKEQESIENNHVEQKIVETPVIIRTAKTFSEELKQLAQQDAKSKAVLDYYNEKVFIKHIFPLLNNDEKILSIRHIVHHNYANTIMRGGVINTKEFFLITNKRVIKFVKSLWLKPKIRSCYFSQILSIEDAKSGGRLHGVFIGEKLRINSNVGQITLRTMGRGSSHQAKLDILQIMNENNLGNSSMETEKRNETNHPIYEHKRKFGMKGVILGCLAVFIVAGALFLWAGAGTEVSDYIFSSKDDILKFISEQGLVDEDDIGIYHNDGLLLMLTEQGTLYSISVESPEYKLFGITIGDEFIDSKDGGKLLDYGFGFLDKIEGVNEKNIYYGILCEGKPDNEQMIEIRTDENNKVIAVAYGRNDEEIYAELGIELGDENLDNSTETKSSQENSSVKSGNEKKVMDLVKQYEGEWWDLNSQRCYMNIEAIGGNKLSIIVSWSNGYADDSKWEMTGQINEIDGKIVYHDCTQYDIFDDENGERKKKTNYRGGKGCFYMKDDGYLYWVDREGFKGVGCYFEKSSENTEIPEATDYSVNLPLESVATMYVVQCKASITLRNAPSTNATEITQIPLYAGVDYYGTLDNGFAQVAYNGQVGYVLGSYLDYYEPQVYTGIKCQIVNCKQSVTLRTSITAQDKEICQIPLGTIIDYIEEGANGYCLVNYNGIMGYVKQDYLLFL